MLLINKILAVLNLLRAFVLMTLLCTDTLRPQRVEPGGGNPPGLVPRWPATLNETDEDPSTPQTRF